MISRSLSAAVTAPLKLCGRFLVTTPHRPRGYHNKMGVIASTIAFGTKIKERSKRKKEEKIISKNFTQQTTASYSTSAKKPEVINKEALKIDTNIAALPGTTANTKQEEGVP